MGKPVIICVDDQREVLATLRRELSAHEDMFEVVYAESSQEARELLEEFDDSGELVLLVICDHIMPGESGIDFLVSLSTDRRFSEIRKLLLTGLATHEDTIRAINDANIDHYVQKPWQSDELLAAIATQITYRIMASGIDYQPYLALLDQKLLYKLLAQRV